MSIQNVKLLFDIYILEKKKQSSQTRLNKLDTNYIVMDYTKNRHTHTHTCTLRVRRLRSQVGFWHQRKRYLSESAPHAKVLADHGHNNNGHEHNRPEDEACGKGAHVQAAKQDVVEVQRECEVQALFRSIHDLPLIK